MGMDVSNVHFKPRVNPDAKVTRYRKGQVPEWAKTGSGGGGGGAEGGEDDMYQVGKGRRGLKGLGKIKVGSGKRHGDHGHGEEAAAGGPPSDGDADLPSDSGASDSSDSGSGSDSDSDSSGALSEDLNVINAVEEPPEEDEAEVAARRARIRDRLRARDQAIAAEGAVGAGAAGGSGGGGGGSGGNGALAAAKASVDGLGKARGTLGPALDGMALPAAPLTMSGLRELKGRLTGKPAHRPGRRSDDSDSNDDSDSDGPAAAKAKAAVSGAGISAGRHFRTGSSTSASSSSGSSESESEEDEVMLRPVFRPKEQRETVLEREKLEEAEEAKAQAYQAELDRRREESKRMVADIITREETAAKAVSVEEVSARPDDTDRPEEKEADMQAWAVRELQRIKTVRQERAAAEEEQAETERRRNLTDEQREAEDKILEQQGLKVFKKEKQKMGFMQKYHHKGAFYLDESSVKAKEDVRLRDNKGATGLDVFNKEALPKVLQVRGADFGKRSRTKWTHLVAEDTTFAAPGNAWTSKNDPLRQQFERKLAGTGDINTAGRVVRGGGKRKAPGEDDTI